MNRYWSTLQPRERRIVLIGATLLLVLGVYALIWAPLTERTATLRENVRAERETLDWMRQAASEVTRLRGRAAPAGAAGGPLLTRVDTAARSHGLADALKRVQPEGSDNIRVWLEGASFDAVLRWLHEIAGGGVQISALVVDRAETPGSINARVTLSGSGG